MDMPAPAEMFADDLEHEGLTDALADFEDFITYLRYDGVLDTLAIVESNGQQLSTRLKMLS